MTFIDPLVKNVGMVVEEKCSNERTADQIFMAFPQPQHEAVFVSRPQRFLAKIQFPDGADEVAYFPNPGSMSGCLLPRSEALLWDSNDLRRKRRFTLRAVEFNGTWIGTDTHLSNRIIEEAIRLKLIPGLEDYDFIVREQLVTKGFRVDFLLKGSENVIDCILEVKTSLVVTDGVARYPDCKTPRGVKQLHELAQHASAGKRAIVIFLVQRSDVDAFMVISKFDPDYAAAFDGAVASGVEVIAVCVDVSRAGFGRPRALPIVYEARSHTPPTSC